ncbi:hypothetical protein DES44_2725 [Roseateles depolymerans]|uniref:Uncharacterized protein n=1 Tax=Roseateles depolymerans TaxID=76731 RepID=A0A0U3MW39_9BURK|nr:hypothetical protein RD2015_2770 [Roseateles depolymerans]REG20218.1 hypothetical protein DES44_2725 [Roseateles depolymerans]
MRRRKQPTHAPFSSPVTHADKARPDRRVRDGARPNDHNNDKNDSSIDSLNDTVSDTVSDTVGDNNKNHPSNAS